MSINLFLESLWSFVPGQVLKSGCPILSIMEDLLLILHLIPWTLCAFFFFPPNENNRATFCWSLHCIKCFIFNINFNHQILFCVQRISKTKKKIKSMLLSDVSKMTEQKALDSSFTQHPNSTRTWGQKSLCEISRNWFKAVCNLVCVCTQLLM